MEAWVQRTGWEPPSYPDDEETDDGGIGTVNDATGGTVSPGTAQS
jgi:dephospho-CoA kinase